MEKIASDIFSLWREEGSRLIQENFQIFRTLVAETQKLAAKGHYEAAAMNACLAAYHAQHRHCGLFVSPELEQILIAIGQKAIQNSFPSPSRPGSPPIPKNILHIATNISGYSGIPRFVRRWIQQDKQRSHSLVLTKQASYEIPKILRDAVNNSHGKIYQLDENNGGFVDRAKQLVKIAAHADVVFLHTWEQDVVPMIAFANPAQSPPIIRVNHGDHCFWLGAGISDVVANLRESGMGLARERRGIEVERNLLLPTILEPADRKVSRIEGKRQLGLPETSILLLSIARAPKYKTIDGVSFADVHISLLQQYKQAMLIVIGPGDTEDWSPAIEQVEGRIRVLGQTEDTALFYQAADIYVDSFPFVSITSLLEAGSYGVPLVSRYPFYDGCEILGSDMPGLTGNLIRVRNLEDYIAALSHLVENEEYRLSLGEGTKRKIEETHWGMNWQAILENVYTRAVTLPQVSRNFPSTDRMFLSDPDVFLPAIHSGNFDPGWVNSFYSGAMPFQQKLQIAIQRIKQSGVRGQINLLLPGFLVPYYLRLRSFLRRHKLLNQK